MAIQRWDPLRDMVLLKERMNKMFEEALSRSAGAAGAPEAGGWTPPVDLHEENDEFVLCADLPGISPSDLDIQVEDETLIIRGSRQMDRRVPTEAYLRVERPYGRFTIRLALPPAVDGSGIHATGKDGILTVRLPKAKVEAGTRKVKVHVS